MAVAPCADQTAAPAGSMVVASLRAVRPRPSPLASDHRQANQQPDRPPKPKGLMTERRQLDRQRRCAMPLTIRGKSFQLESVTTGPEARIDSRSPSRGADPLGIEWG